MTLNAFHVFSKIFTTTNSTSCLPHFTLWQPSVATHVTMALPCHHVCAWSCTPSTTKQTTSLSPVPEVCLIPGTAPMPLAACYWLPIPGVVPLKPLVPREPPVLIAQLQFWTTFSGSLALLLLPALFFPIQEHPCTDSGSLNDCPFHSSSFNRVSAWIFAMAIYDLSLLLNFSFLKVLVSPTRQQSLTLPCLHDLNCTTTCFLLSHVQLLLLEVHILLSFASFTACSPSPPVLDLGFFILSFSIICLLKWQ